MKKLLSLKWRREDHAGGWAAVGEKFFDEVFEFGHGGQDDLEQEGVVAGEMVTLLHCVEGGEELEEGLVTGALAGEADEGRDGEAEGLEIDVGSIAAYELEALKAAETFGCGGGGEAYSTAELGDGETCVGGELAQYLAVDGVDSSVQKHVALLVSFVGVSANRV